MNILLKILVASVFIVTTSFIPVESKYDRQLREIENNLEVAKTNLEQASSKLND